MSKENKELIVVLLVSAIAIAYLFYLSRDSFVTPPMWNVPAKSK